MTYLKKALAIGVLLPMVTTSYAALSLDRTRIIYNGADPALSMRISNTSERLPFLGQTWFEDEKGNKIETPFVATPPIQRIEPKQQSQIKIQYLKNSALPQDRESVVYFNFRQIPPKSDKPNVLQLTVQTKLKLFYRPESIFADGTKIIDQPWQNKLVIKNTPSGLVAQNPTPYYTTITKISPKKDAEESITKEPFMVAPFSELPLDLKLNQMGQKPYLTYVNDYGAKIEMPFQCGASQCAVTN